jgi:hypothetical protein
MNFYICSDTAVTAPLCRRYQQMPMKTTHEPMHACSWASDVRGRHVISGELLYEQGLTFLVVTCSYDMN